MTGSSSDLIQLRMKLVGNKLVVSGTDQVSKSVKGLGKATGETARKTSLASTANSRLTTSYKKLGSAAKWGLGFLGVGGVLAIESSIHASEELGKTTSALTRNFGLQNNVASRWAAVAQSREIDSKALSMSFGTLSSKIVEAAHKGGTALTPFHRLGISQEELVAHANDTQWSLMRVAKALGEEEGGTKRSTTAKALFGKSWSTLVPLFSEGTKGLKEQLHWADKYGVTMSGTTTEGIMEMVQAQRENKVAMLGLQLSLTKALMPAIHAGDEELQKFIATLNSPNLTAEQKISRISHQFLGLQDDIIRIIEQALPVVAEHAGQLGFKMAGAILHGFEHSNVVGKIVIAAWIFDVFGGKDLAKAGARKVGGELGTEMGFGLALGAVGAFAGYELGHVLEEKTHGEFHRWAISEAENFVNTFTGAFNTLMDKSNVLSFLGVDAPTIPEVHLKNAEEEVAEGKHITHHALPPGQIPPGSEGPGITSPLPGSGRGHRHGHRVHHGGRSSSRVPRIARAPRRHELMATPPAVAGRGSQRPIVIKIEHKSELDGKIVAESVTEHSLDAAALK